MNAENFEHEARVARHEAEISLRNNLADMWRYKDADTETLAERVNIVTTCLQLFKDADARWKSLRDTKPMESGQAA